MQFRRKKTLMDRAHDVAEQVAETVIPALETALEQTREKAGPALTDARDRALPLLAEGRAIATEKAALATERASASASVAAERAQLGAALAADQAAVGRTLAAAKMAELRGETPEPESSGRLKKVLLLSGVLALAGVLFSKLRGGKKESANWQSSYTPTPPPASRPSAATSPSTTSTGSDATPAAGTPPADGVTSVVPASEEESHVPSPATGGDPLTDPLPGALSATPEGETEDVGGGAPGEAISDTVEEPRQPSTPDSPTTVIDIDDVPRDRQ